MQAVAVTIVLLLSGGIAFAQPTAQTLLDTPSSPNPAQSCLSDICGPPSESNTYMSQYVDRLRAYNRARTESPSESNFPPAIAKLIADIQDTDEKQNQLAASLFKSGAASGDSRLEGFAKAFYNISYLSPYFAQWKYAPTLVDGKLHISFDEKTTRENLNSTNLPNTDRDWFIEVSKYILSTFENESASKNAIQTRPPSLLLKQLHPGLSLSEAMKREYEQAKANVAELKNASPLEGAAYFVHTSPDRIASIGGHIADGSIDENETREIILWNNEFKLSHAWFGNPNSPIMARESPTLDEILKKGGGPDAILKVYMQSHEADRKKEDGNVQACRLQYFINKSLLPSRDQVTRLKQDIKRSKQLVVDMIRAKFPSSVQQKLIDAVESSDFISPPSTDDFERSFAQSLQQKLNAEKTQLAAMQKIAPEDMQKLFAVVALAKKNESSSDKSDDSNPFCDAFKYDPMSDGNYTTFGSVILSFTTATGTEGSRLKTVMHELGHTISHTLYSGPKDAQQYRSIRSCLAGQHTEALPEKTKKEYEEARSKDPTTDGPYAEEDFADAVSGESGKGVPGKNSWCQFLSLTPDRKQYQDSSMQADDGDPHSSGVFRLLNFEAMRSGTMPDSCKSYLATSKYSVRFSSCLDLARASPNATSPTGAVQ